MQIWSEIDNKVSLTAIYLNKNESWTQAVISFFLSRKRKLKTWI